MRLPLILCVLAALLSWSALRFQSLTIQAAHPITDPTRSQASPVAAAVHPNALHVDPTLPTAPPLFRAAHPLSLEPQPGDRLDLIGLAGRAEARVAFLRDAADGRTFTVRPGDEVRNWSLEEASERCVVLRRGRQRETECLS